MEDNPRQLPPRTFVVGAADGRFTFGPEEGRPAKRAFRCEFDHLFAPVPQISEGFYDVGDDVAGSFEQYFVAQAQVLILNEILVVEADAGDHDAGQADGRRLSHGRDRADLSDLIFHVFERRRRLFCGKFIGDGPAGVVAGVAGAFLEHEVIYLHDHAVYFVGVRLPAALPTSHRIPRQRQCLKRVRARSRWRVL